MEPEIVGKRVIKLMDKHNMKREELAIKMELEIGKLNDKLDGKEEFYLDEIIKLKNIFNLNIEECDEIFFQESKNNNRFA